VIDPLTTVLFVGSGLLAALAGFFTIRNRRIDNSMLGLTALVELAILAQLVVGITQVVSTDHPVNKALFIAYLVGMVFVLPVAALWAIAERSRWGMGVMVVAGLALLVLVGRLQQLWAGADA